MIMQDYLEKMMVAMELKGFAKSTMKAYLAQIKGFAEYCGKHPAACGYDEVRSFLHYGIKVKKLSSSYVVNGHNLCRKEYSPPMS